VITSITEAHNGNKKEIKYLIKDSYCLFHKLLSVLVRIKQISPLMKLLHAAVVVRRVLPLVTE
jgi:hypothetical protein